ncbi:MAG: DNA-3-methyladenine glycosylase family protein [Candidatus Actinomarina sp.]|tara:strand:- start:855 stop:1460 length:606 start_codon:yes stop_codon:yes gene_type:complete
MKKPLGKSELFLIDNDKLLAPVIKRNGHITFSNKKTDVFNELVNIVISQFISTKAAKAIKQNMLSRFNEEIFKIKNFENLSTLQIKNLGLSNNKAKSIKDIIAWNNSKPSKKYIFEIPKDDRESELKSIFGIGQWSIDMFEMFCVRNINTFSSGDAALREAMTQLGMVESGSSLDRYDKYSEKWSPYKTYACLHLWHMIES